MVCEHCGAAARDGATVCDQCGAMLPVHEMGKGVAAIRQGRSRGGSAKAHVGSGVPSASRSDLPLLDEKDRASHIAREESASQDVLRHKGRIGANRPNRPSRSTVNWAMICLVCAVLAVLSVAGGFLFLNLTPQGQLIMARFGYEADATALWKLGQEYLDQGYIERSIETFEKAYAQEPQIDGVYEHLQQLCEAYEAAARPDDAEELYKLMYLTIDPKNPEAYRNVARIMRDQNRETELAEFLRLAYTNTSEITFKIQRDEMVPSIPTTNLNGGRLLLPKDVELSSPEGYDIYYAIIENEENDDTILPEDGQLYTAPIHLEEGGWTIRAVAVSSDLVSDELNVRYIITLPVPDAPKANLAPGSYDRKQRLRLRNVGDDKNVTFYYTIDSSQPTINSPIYTDEGILLPGGRVVVRAVAVNSYGKVSNEMSVELQINVAFKKYYRNTDGFGKFTIMETKMEDFIKAFGEPSAQREFNDPVMNGSNCIELTYSWGAAKFYYAEKGALLYYFDMTGSSLVAPRKTSFGMEEREITNQFRDMGQAKNQDGSRNLYYDSAEGCYGKIYIIDDTHKRIDYIHEDKSTDTTVTLSYYLENNKCNRIINSYVIN